MPSEEVHEIIEKLCTANEFSQSKVTGLLVEEALRSRGVLNESFGQNEFDKEDLINFSLEKESKEQGKELRSHFLHLLAHGILHLLGETHHKIDDERKMEALEIDFLKRLNITNPYKI